MSLERVVTFGSSPRGQISPRDCFSKCVNCLNLRLVSPGVKSGLPIIGVMGEGNGDRSVVRNIFLATRRVAPISGWDFKSAGGGDMSHGDESKGIEESSISIPTHCLESLLQCQSAILAKWTAW